MKFLNADAPQFPPDAIAAAARRHFGLTGTLQPLYGERDQNVRLQTEDNRSYVVKIFNSREDAGLIDGQIAALQHVAEVDASLPVQRIVPTLDGKSWVSLVSPGGTAHRMIVTTWLDGDIAGGRNFSDRFFHRLGGLQARLGLALRGFHHRAIAGRDLLWDIRRAPQLLAHADRLGSDEEAAAARRIIADYAERTAPRLKTLRHQVLHADLHEHNLIVGPEETIAGIIDFGDMLFAPLIFDAAVALADFMTSPARMPQMLGRFVAGYNSTVPLEEAEIDCLYDLVLTRLIATRIIAKYRAAQTPDDPNYIAAFDFAPLETIRTLMAMGREAVTGQIRAACHAGDARTGAGPGIERLIARRKRAMGSDLYVFYDPPLHIVRGEGAWLVDAAGRRYLDCYNNVPIVGHCHPQVIEAISRQVRILNTNTRYLGEQVLEYAERLTALTGGELSVCLFVNSGSEANDIAWRMARVWSGARGGLCQEFAYHGITEAIDALSPSASRTGRIAPHVRTLLAPDGYRGPIKTGAADFAARYAADAARAIAELDAAGFGTAAVIVDSAFMTNGILEPVPGYVEGVFARVRAAGGLCIADEVQAGFGRMGGSFWGYMHHGVIPDVVTIGKPAGNGHPVGAIVTRPDIYEKFLRETAFFSTFGGNNVSAAAGLAVLDVIEAGGLVAQASRVGGHFKSGLRGLMAKHAIIGDIRGLGLGFGVELVRDRATLEPARAETTRLLNLMRDEGVLVGNEGVHGNIVKMRPPLIFTMEQADFAVAAMDRALARL